MQIETIRGVKGNMEGDFDTSRVAVGASVAATKTVANATAKVKQTSEDVKALDGRQDKQEKEPSRNTIDSVVSEANQKMRLTKTRCEYSYDEPTKRVSIKVYDKDSGTLIREVPPEKSLEMLQKMWEIAGIIVDEKR